jgi:hypothetical protein
MYSAPSPLFLLLLRRLASILSLFSFLATFPERRGLGDLFPAAANQPELQILCNTAMREHGEGKALKMSRYLLTIGRP